MNSPRRPRSLRPAHLIAGLAAVALALAIPTVASAKDRNHDRIPDRWERSHRLSLKVNQAKRDQDRDGLKNRQEWRARMDPRDADSDDDGIEDGDEGAGRIASFDPGTGELTINVMNGGSVTGLVTDATEVKCDDGDDHGDEDGDSGGHDHGHDDRAARSDGQTEPGDDHECDDETPCTVDDLAPGTTVQEASLEIEGGTATWEEIELLK
jgi:hypothetical protein